MGVLVLWVALVVLSARGEWAPTGSLVGTAVMWGEGTGVVPCVLRLAFWPIGCVSSVPRTFGLGRVVAVPHGVLWAWMSPSQSVAARGPALMTRVVIHFLAWTVSDGWLAARKSAGSAQSARVSWVTWVAPPSAG